MSEVRPRNAMTNTTLLDAFIKQCFKCVKDCDYVREEEGTCARQRAKKGVGGG